MDYTILINNEVLQHHGILGQKWGIRRFQNKDGSLTKLGRKRLGKDATKLGELKTEIARNTRDSYAFRKNPQFVADYENKKVENEKKYNELYDKMIKKYGEQNVEDLDSIPEFKNAAHLGELHMQRLSEMIERDKLEEEYSNMTAKETSKYLRDQKLFSEEIARENPERAKKVAEFGLSVMKDVIGDNDVDPKDKGWQHWYIWEDQTIGYPTIADMVMRGDDLRSIKKTLGVARRHGELDDTKIVKNDKGEFVLISDNPDYDNNIPGAFQLREGNNYRNALEKYAKACIDYKNSHK